tara:strand:- start:6580 stop:7188 length:609 start_codon:yes stop_codon:yes gene_type:complete
MENFRKFIDAGGEAAANPEANLPEEAKQAVATISYFLGYIEKLQKEIELYGRDSASERPVAFPRGMHELYKVLKSVAYNVRTFHYDLFSGEYPLIEDISFEFKELGYLDAEDKVRNDVFVSLLDLESMFFQEVVETGMSFDSAVGIMNDELSSERFQRYEAGSHENTKGKVREISNIVKNDNEAQLALDDFMHDSQRRHRRN